MIKRLLITTALLMGCDTMTSTTTVMVTDTILLENYTTITDTVMVEYDYYYQDTARIILAEQGRYLITNYWNREDTVLDYTSARPGFEPDTVHVPLPRLVYCLYWSNDLKRERVSFKNETLYLKDGWEYRINDGTCNVSEINE